MLKSDISSSKLSSVLSNLCVALAVMSLVIGGEYVFRHYILFWMPTIGTLRVNDMLSLFLVYCLLLAGIGQVMKTDWQQELAGVWQAVQESARSLKSTFWFLLLVLSTVSLPLSLRCCTGVGLRSVGVRVWERGGEGARRPKNGEADHVPGVARAKAGPTLATDETIVRIAIVRKITFRSQEGSC